MGSGTADDATVSNAVSVLPEFFTNTANDSDTESTLVHVREDVSSKVNLLWPASYTNLGNQQFRGVFTVINKTSQTITGPIQLHWTSLPAGVTVVSSTTTGSLAPSQAGTIVVIFQNVSGYPLSNLEFFFKPLVLAG